MNILLSSIEGICCIAGIMLGLLLLLAPRFGPGSRRLLLMLLPASFSAGVLMVGPFVPQVSPAYFFMFSFVGILLSVSGGYVASCALRQRDGNNHIGSVVLLTLTLLVIVLVTAPAFFPFSRMREGYISLGPSGYLTAIFMLLGSVVVLAGIEQVLRHYPETVKWVLKLLFTGIGVIYVAGIYLSAMILKYSFHGGLLSIGAIRVFHILFFLACILIFLSWKRSSGEMRVTVSHSAVHSFITLLSVGTYLIIAGALSRLAGHLNSPGLPLEALVFIVALVVLVILLLATGVRHKTRAWVRRNIFAGKYDYRQAWIEAAERIRSIDPQETTASALVDIIQKAMGASDIGIWVRRWNPNRLQLLRTIGRISAQPGQEELGIVEELMDIAEPLSLKDLQQKDNIGKTLTFMKNSNAALLVPMLSSNRILGIITVGKNQSGYKYGREGREFLRVLALYAAGEFHKSDLLESLITAKEDEAFRAFSTFVLHDLKNFASTLSYIAQNAPKHQNNPEFLKDTFQSVFETAEKMKRMCNSLRTFSGALAADKKVVDLNQLIRSIADTLNVGLRDHLRLELGDIPLVLLDEDDVGRVLHNLLLNAREAIADNGVITVCTQSGEGWVEIIVTDNGCGMSPEFLKNGLFMPFKTTKSLGLGIGLFHSKKIMDAHGGTILVESEEGRGTRITLRFSVKRKLQNGNEPVV